MTCDQIQKQVHLFDELTDAGKAEMHEHLAGCAACREVYEGVRQMQSIIQRTVAVDLAPPHAARITSRVMEGIRPKPLYQGFFSGMLSAIEGRWLPWTLAAASIVLMSLLLVEQLQPGYPAQPSRNALSRGMVLNQRVFRDQLSKRKETEQNKRTTACRSPFKSAQTTAACLRQKYSGML